MDNDVNSPCFKPSTNVQLKIKILIILYFSFAAEKQDKMAAVQRMSLLAVLLLAPAPISSRPWYQCTYQGLVETMNLHCDSMGKRSAAAAQSDQSSHDRQIIKGVLDFLRQDQESDQDTSAYDPWINDYLSTKIKRDPYAGLCYQNIVRVL